MRASPLTAVVLTNADVDHVAGLLNLRESQPLALYGHPRVLDVLARNSIFNVLSPVFVTRRPLYPGDWEEIRDQQNRPLGIAVRAFSVPGKIALWLEDATMPGLGSCLNLQHSRLSLRERTCFRGAKADILGHCLAMPPIGH